MRSRPDIALWLSPTVAEPGATLHAKLRLTSHGETPFEAIDLTLTGTERRYKRTNRTQNNTRRVYHRREVISLGRRFPGGTLGVGTHEYEVGFPLPPALPPTYRSSLTTIAYTVGVRVHIPWWPDAVAEYELSMRPSASPLGPSAPLVVTTQQGENRGEDPVLEMSLASQNVQPGGVLSGALALTGSGDRRIKRLTVAWVAIESALVYSAAGPTEVDRRAWVVREGSTVDGEQVPFRLEVPGDVTTGMTTPFIQVTHQLVATAEVAWGRDIELRVPVSTVHQGPSAPAGVQVPSVGRTRNREVWLAARDSLRLPGVDALEVDPDAGSARFIAAGVSVEAREEHHPRADRGPCVAVELRYPSLGLELRVAERSWTDLGGRFDWLDEGFRDRFTASAREPDQARAILTPSIQSALTLFDEAGLGDDCVSAVRKGGVYRVEGLQRVLLVAYNLARELSSAAGRVPPPGALAKHLGAWQAFARDREARLRVGDLSLHEWRVRAMALSLEHRFEKGAPVASRLSAAVPPSDKERQWSEALTRAAERPVTVSAGTASMELPLVTDPRSCVEDADRFAIALGQLLTGASAGAYR